MHRRKQFLIYPPNYNPNATPYRKYKVRHSKRQAWKVAVKMGEGASVDVSVQTHPARGKDWKSSSSYALWEVTERHNARLTGAEPVGGASELKR